MGRLSTFEQHIGGVLSWVRLDSIKNKIVALALLATLLPTFTTAVVSYTQNKRSLTKGVNEELRNVGSQTARELDIWVREQFFAAGVFTNSFEAWENLERIPQGGPQSIDALSRLTDYVTAVQALSPFLEILILDPQGERITSSHDSSASVPVPADWHARLRGGNPILGEPYWDAGQSRVTALLAQPITSQSSQRYLGVLVARIDFNAVNDLLEVYAPGSSGRVYVLSADHVMVASSAPMDEMLQPVAVRPALDTSDSTVATIEYSIDGRRVLGTVDEVPRVDWAVVTEIPLNEAYAPVRRLRNVTLLVVSLLLVIVGSIAYALGVLIVRPLDRLSTGAAKVASGDLSVGLPVTGGGEVGYVTQVFNDMVNKLRSGREALDEASEELRTQNLELERLSVTDGLTDLTNRRRAMEIFTEEIERAERQDHTLGVLMMDVDHFKNYNDTYGHVEGDAVLRGVAKSVKQATRGIDTPARYGGEEFMVLLPECDVQGALEAAERIRHRLSEEEFHGGNVTMSIGVAAYPEHGGTPDALIRAADAALYHAKEKGRDRVALATPLASGKARRQSGAAKRKTRAQKATPKKTTKKRASKKSPPAD